MNKIKIGITGIGSLIGQAIIKSIKISSLRDRISMVGFDYFEDTIGSYWVDKSFLLPDFLKDNISENEWLKKLIEIIKTEDIKIIFPGVDFELPLFAKNKKMIEDETGVKIMVSDCKVIDIADDKYKTFLFLKENDFSYPETWLPNELGNGSVKFPCFIKPKIGARSRDAFVVKDNDDLLNKIKAIKDPIVQELVGNPDSEYTCGAIVIGGEVKGSIVLKRKLKEGNTETACYKKDTPEIIYDYVNKIALKLNPYGACNFQLRLTENNIPKLFEINARHSGTTYMRALFGFNEVEYIISHVLRLGVIKEFSPKEGTAKRFYEEKIVSEK